MVGNSPTEFRNGALGAFAGLASFHATIQLVCVASAVLDLTIDRGRALAAIALALAVSLVFASRFLTRPTAGSPSASIIGSSPWIAPVSWLVTSAVLLWSVGVWVRLWLLAMRRPPYDWDGLSYHIPAIHEWVRAGHIGWIDNLPDVPFVNYPMAIEANTFLMYQALGDSRLVSACNLWYWPLAFFAVVVLARFLGARGAWPWLAGALLAGVPVFVTQSVTAYIDPSFSASVMAAITASVLPERPDENSHREDAGHWNTDALRAE